MPDRENVLSDSVTFTLDRPTFKRLAIAKIVEYRIGIFQSKLKPKELEYLKILLGLGTVIK